MTSINKFSQLNANHEETLKHILLYAYKMCPLYKKRFLEVGVSEPDLVKFSLSELSRLPSVDVNDLRNYWHQLSVINEDTFRATTSGGTTGKPKFMVRNRTDWDISVDSHVRVLTTAGLQPGHRLLVAVPFDLWSIGFLTMETCKEIGCMAIPVGVRMLDEAVLDIVEEFQINAVFTTPSRWEHLSGIRSELCANHPGMLMLLAGEVLPNHLREMLETLWHGKVRNVYGSEETDGLGSECGFGSSGMHILTDRFIFEVDQKKDGVKPLINEGCGELLITSLYHQGTPLIRYRTGDYVEIRTTDCPCGNASPKIKVYGKLSEVIVLRDATRLFAYQIQEVIQAAIGTDVRFQVVASINETNGSELLEIRLPIDVATSTANLITKLLIREHPEIADSVDLGMLNVITSVGTIAHQQTIKDKEHRFIDLRRKTYQ